jgi:hypothetical protein
MGEKRSTSPGQSANPGPAVAAGGGAAAVGAFFAALFAALMSWLFDIGKKAFIGLLSRIAMAAFHTFVRVAPDEAISMMQSIVDTYYTPPPEWAAFIGRYLERMTGATIDYSQIAREGFGITSTTFMQQIGHTFLEPILNLILPGSDKTIEAKGLPPEEGVRGAERYMAANLQFQMSAWLLHLFGDILSFGMWKALKDLPNAISWSYGLGWLSWLVLGVPFRITIADPMEKYFRELYRPNEFTREMVAWALQAQYITEDDARERLRQLGWPEEDIVAVLNYSRKVMSDSDMEWAWRRNKIDREYIKEAIRSQGFSPDEADIQTSRLLSKRFDSIIDKIASEAIDNYIDGSMTWDEVVPFLQQAYYTDDEIEALKVLADLKRIPKPKAREEERVLSKSDIGWLYHNRKISEQEARMLWASIGVNDADIPYLLMRYEPPQPKPLEPREISAAVIGGLYKRNQITREQAIADWEALGFSGWQLERLEMYYRPPAPPPPKEVPPKELPVSWIFQLHESGAKDTEWCVERLMRLGLREEDARLILTQLHPPKPEEALLERVRKTKSIGLAYEQGLITEEEAVEAWRALGYTMEEIDYLLLAFTPKEKKGG